MSDQTSDEFHPSGSQPVPEITSDKSAAAKEKDYEVFVQLFAQHESKLKGFLRSLLPNWNDVDDVIQEACLIMWRKFDTFEQGTNFMAWASMIVRFEVMRLRRKKARDKHIFDDEVMALISDELGKMDESEAASERQQALDDCIKSLPQHHQALLNRAYLSVAMDDSSSDTGKNTIKGIAEEIGRPPAAVYKLLSRLRGQLFDCIELKIGRISG